MNETAINSKEITENKSFIFASKIIHFLLFYFIVLILLISGIAKIIDPLPIIKSLEAFKLFSFTPFENEINIFIATTLPIIEIGLAVLLIMKTKLNVVLPLTLLLFSAFLIYAVYGYYLGITDDCGCFGSLDDGLLSALGIEFIEVSKHGVGMIVRNVGFVIVVGYLNFKEIKNYWPVEVNKSQIKVEYKNEKTIVLNRNGSILRCCCF